MNVTAHKGRVILFKCLSCCFCSLNIWLSNQIKSLLLSHHRSTSTLVSEILTSVLQTVQKKQQQCTYGQYIFTDCTEDNVQNTHTYTQYTVYYKDILSYQYTLYTVCTHLCIVICEGATDYKFTADGCATDSCAEVQ